MTLMQYSDDLYAKWCKVADDYDEATSTDILIEGVNSSMCHGLHNTGLSTRLQT